SLIRRRQAMAAALGDPAARLRRASSRSDRRRWVTCSACLVMSQSPLDGGRCSFPRAAGVQQGERSPAGISKGSSAWGVMEVPDVIVVGDGPAGLSAALFLARKGKSVTVIGARTTGVRNAYLYNVLGI